MNSKHAFLRTGLAVAAGCALAFAGSAVAKSSAVPAGVASFDGTNCTATFVRSASGIVNETNRTCAGAQNPWISANVILQFRPLSPASTPNPACDPVGLVTSFGPWSTNEGSISPWFMGPTYTYNVCVYLENPVVASGSIDATDADGVTTAGVPLAGTYQVCVNGTWSNRGGVDAIDAEYISQDGWTTWFDGLPPADPYAYLGADFGDVQINDAFVAWGAYNSGHNYCVNQSLSAGQTVNLSIFDGNAGVKEAGWYGDNSGTLAYTVKYMGL